MATKRWERVESKYGVLIQTVSLDAGDKSVDLNMSDFCDKTVQISSASFGNSWVDLQGFNIAETPPQDLHCCHDPSLTLSGIRRETLALILENPVFLRAQVHGSKGHDITVTITGCKHK